LKCADVSRFSPFVPWFFRGAPVAAMLSLALGAAACGRTYRAGDEVMVEWHGKEYPALILTAAPDGKFKVHFDGYEDTWDESVAKSRIKGFRKGDEPRPEPPAEVRAKALEAAQSNRYHLGDQVRVEWADKYYNAQVVEVVGKEQYRVHYEGYGSEWDENVGLSRIQPR
jgi:hypothetical protein